MADFRGIRPSITMERDYYRSVYYSYVQPYIAGVSKTLSQLPSGSTARDLMSAAESYKNEWMQEYNPEIIVSRELAAAIQMERSNDIANSVMLMSLKRGWEAEDAIDWSEYADDPLGRLREFLESIDKEEPREGETLTEMLRRRWKQETDKDALKARAGRIAKGVDPFDGELMKIINNLIEGYMNVIFRKVDRWTRIALEAHEILFEGKARKLVLKAILDHLKRVEKNIKYWVDLAKRIKDATSLENAKLLIDQFARRFGTMLEKKWDEILTAMEDRIDNRLRRYGITFDDLRKLGAQLKVFYRAFVLGDDSVRDQVDIILRKYTEYFMNKLRAMGKNYADKIKAEVDEWIDGLFNGYARRVIDIWAKAQKYIDQGEVDLDLLYKDYLASYLEEAERRWEDAERKYNRLRQYMSKGGGQFIFEDFFAAYTSGVLGIWERWENDWSAIQKYFEKGGYVKFFDDAITLALNQAESRIIDAAKLPIRGIAEETVMRWMDKATRRLNQEYFKMFVKVAKVDIRPALANAATHGVLQEIAHDNVGLIKNIIPRFHENLEKNFIKAEMESPLDLQKREKLYGKYLRKSARFTRYNLRRITRDQSNKLYGRLAKVNQQSVGIHNYRWETSEDDRVRPTHAPKDGAVFSWNNPPPDTGHPGEDIQCRCVAIPEISIHELRARHEKVTSADLDEEDIDLQRDPLGGDDWLDDIREEDSDNISFEQFYKRAEREWEDMARTDPTQTQESVRLELRRQQRARAAAYSKSELDSIIEYAWSQGNEPFAEVVGLYGAERVEEARQRAIKRGGQQPSGSSSPSNPDDFSDAMRVSLEGAIEEGDEEAEEWFRDRYGDDLVDQIIDEM